MILKKVPCLIMDYKMGNILLNIKKSTGQQYYFYPAAGIKLAAKKLRIIYLEGSTALMIINIHI